MAMIASRRALSCLASRILRRPPTHTPHDPFGIRFCCDDASSFQRRPGPLALYRRMVEVGSLRFDTYQEKVAWELEKLLGNLEKYEKEMEEYHANLSDWESNRENHRRRLLVDEAELKQQASSKLGTQKRLKNAEPGVGKMVSYLNREKQLDTLVGGRPLAPMAPKGIYLYGNVGSGKTMLMDMFYSATEGIVKHRRRFHFHEAMLEIHELMHDIWKCKVEEYSFSSNIFGWISNLPFDTRVKEWLIGEERYKQEAQLKHILPAVADKFLVDRKRNLTGASILCFDEIQTVDVFAIVALSGILSRLLNTGTVLVATSNRAPEDLNQDGMQQDIFLKLVSKLEENCNKILIGNEIDYRRLIPRTSSELAKYLHRCIGRVECQFVKQNISGQKLGFSEIGYFRISHYKNPKGFLVLEHAFSVGVLKNIVEHCMLQLEEIHYFWPLDVNVRKELEMVWCDVTNQAGGEIISMTIPVMFGRKLEVAESCNGIARFCFEYLCGRPMGAADYIAVAKTFHTVFISDIPVMSMRIRDKARRFITLIDELYNHHCCLYCSAATSIEDLFQGTEEGRLIDLESFQFETEIEGGKLRRNVLAEGNVSTGASPSAIVSILSSREEMFAFRRAVSRLIEMQTPVYLEGVRTVHPYFEMQKQAASA